MDRGPVMTWEDAVRSVVQLGFIGTPAEGSQCMGSGVLLGDHHVLTAKHVVDAILAEGREPRVIVLDHSFTPGKWSLRHRVCSMVASRRDMALMVSNEDLENNGAPWSYALRAAQLTRRVPSVGESVDGYGCPGTSLFTTEGTPAHVMCPGLVHVRRFVLDASLHGFVLTDPALHGVSGGPLFDSEGYLVGITKGFIAQKEAILGPNHYLLAQSTFEGVDDWVDELEALLTPGSAGAPAP